MTWEQRWHPLREEWVVVAAHRQHRPWSGEVRSPAPRAVPRFDPQCHFCPGNQRVGGSRNPDYRGNYVFPNDHPCVGRDAPTDLERPTGIYRNRPADGISRVVCYTPRHDLALSELDHEEVRGLLTTLQDQYTELGARGSIDHVLVFENRGEAVGVSNPHPHCQIYGTNFVFKTIQNEVAVCRAHWRDHGRVLFQDVLAAEKDDGRRVLFENAGAIAFVPYFARYPYEVFVAPKETHPSIAQLAGSELTDFTVALQHVLVKFDNLWRMPFPYVMALHQAPTDGGDYGTFHFHAEFHPPLRKPDLLKYLAGPEIGGGNFLSDASPEDKAAELRAVPDVHYTRTPG